MDELLAEADPIDAESRASMRQDPMWRKRMNQKVRRRTRGRPNGRA